MAKPDKIPFEFACSLDIWKLNQTGGGEKWGAVSFHLSGVGTVAKKLALPAESATILTQLLKW